MSDIEPEDHEEIARRLRDDGQAQAPPDLAGEVMKRVRSEPRRSTSAVRRPLVTLLAASLITVALVAGIAKLGGGGSGSAAGGVSGGGGGIEAHSSDKSGQGQVVQSKVLNDVPKTALQRLKIHGAVPATAGNPTSVYCPLDTVASRFSLFVPYDAWDSVQAQLDSAKRLQSSSHRVTVQLRRLAPGAVWPPELTCP
ncbi:MAG: hypothetical protein QOE17_768 [Gaiellales bacterium]|jgi:hypothetical protein|nr:hypothetical protein [Gaiellales bacterium]